MHVITAYELQILLKTVCILTSKSFAPANSCMIRDDVTTGEIPSSIRVPLLLARITRIQ